MARNRGKVGIRSLIGQWPSHEELDAVAKVARDFKGHPMATAILGAAMVEYHLERLLRPKFTRRDDSTWGRLTGEHGPLGTFASKIIAGHAFALYDDEFRQALNAIKDIRNAFAHSKKVIDFSHRLVTDEMSAIPLPTNKRSKQYRRILTARNVTDNQTAYAVLCVSMSNYMMEREVKARAARNRRHARKIVKLIKSPLFGPVLDELRTRVVGRALSPLPADLQISGPTDPALRELLVLIETLASEHIHKKDNKQK